MAYKITDTQHYADIADALREKTGDDTATYTPAEMADAIADIQAGGGGDTLKQAIDASNDDTIEAPSFVYNEPLTLGTYHFGKLKLDTVRLTGVTNLISGAFNQANIRVIDLPNVLTMSASFTGTYAEEILMPRAQSTYNGSSSSSTFYNVRNLKHVDLSSCSSIGNYTFNKISTLESVDISGPVSVGNYAFYNCSNLSFDITKVTYVGSDAFYGHCGFGMTKNTDITIPCTAIGDRGFRGISYGKDKGFPAKILRLPNVQTVGNTALGQPGYLETVIFGDSISSIGSGLFDITGGASAGYSCGVKNIVITRTDGIPTLAGKFLTVNGPSGSNDTYFKSSLSIWVPDELVDEYKTLTNWSYYSANITPLSGWVDPAEA